MIKDQKQAFLIVDMMQTLIEASIELHKQYSSNNFTYFKIIFEDMVKVLDKLDKLIPQMICENKNLNTDKAIKSIIDSLQRINSLAVSRSVKTLDKIEFELIPLIQDMHMKFYFWGCVFPDEVKVKEYYRSEMVELSCNSYIDEMENLGKYKYDLSVVIVGYNKIEYTKLCVENVLRYLPFNLNYELILINHGSTDGTKEYFESICPTKQIDILVNGGGLSAFSRVIEGMYTLVISNDVVITENAISNMLKCMESDEKIAFIVPTTPNVSNLQSIPAQYTSLEEMHIFAKKNNKYDVFRHEQRVRLCDPLALCRSKYMYSSNGVCSFGYFYSLKQHSFPDDQCALLLRRKGLKLILAKDAYCYHFGSVTLKDEITKIEKDNKIDFYLEGRKEFYNTFGIDPWGTGFCFSPSLFSVLKCNNTTHTNVLGINCGLGSNPLKVRESIKENVHNTDVTIYNITNSRNYLLDLKGVSDYFVLVENKDQYSDAFQGIMFDYIIFETEIECSKNPIDTLKTIYSRLNNNGIIAVYIKDVTIQKNVLQVFKNVKHLDGWFIWEKNKEEV